MPKSKTRKLPDKIFVVKDVSDPKYLVATDNLEKMTMLAPQADLDLTNGLISDFEVGEYELIRTSKVKPSKVELEHVSWGKNATAKRIKKEEKKAKKRQKKAKKAAKATSRVKI